jgi:hypothetical protein
LQPEKINTGRTTGVATFSFSELHGRQGAGKALLQCSWLIAIRVSKPGGWE